MQPITFYRGLAARWAILAVRQLAFLVEIRVNPWLKDTREPHLQVMSDINSVSSYLAFVKASHGGAK